MNNFTGGHSADIINVVDEFDYSTQHSSYNTEFIKWRKQRNNPFTFNFRANQREIVYIEGRGFVARYPLEEENDVLSKIFYTLGLAALIWLVMDTIAVKLVAQVLSIFGFSIHTTIFNSSLYGGSVEIVSLLIASSLLKVLVPTIFLNSKFKVPKNVRKMDKMTHPIGLVLALSMTLILCTIKFLPKAYSNDTREIYAYFSTLNTDVEMWGQLEVVIYSLFDIVIMSILSELFFRGAMFAVLRQFGDPFAILITSITAAMLTTDLREAIPVFFLSLIASYGMLRSGSIFTAMSVSVIYKMYELAITLLEVDPSEDMPLTRNFFILIVFITGAILMFIAWLIDKNGTDDESPAHGLAIFTSKQTFGMRVFNSVKIFPYSAVAAVCFVYAIIKLVY